MAIVGGLDVHRKQITFDYLDTSSGEVRRGRLPGTRLALRDWLERLQERPGAFAVEGCTGWRFVVEELRRAGMTAHLAEPADTRALRGPKRHAKTDGIDARHLRDLLQAGTLPESWIPPEHVQEMRTRVRLYKDLVDERTTWQQRIRAILFHSGVSLEGDLLVEERRRLLEVGEGLSPAAREAVAAALRQIDRLAGELAPLRQAFARFAVQQPGCRALTQEYGIGSLLAVAIWAELGDCRRFSSSRDAVRHTGIDITVHSSDGKRTRGHLARQGPPVLRWALFEAAQAGARQTSPDREYFAQVKARLGGNRAVLSLARKFVRRAHHRLRALGDQAMVAVG
jgi:transposase